MQEKYIYVPQGCYAEITQHTDSYIVGLSTCGIGPCCHITIANPNTRYLLLCHADVGTDLKDEEHGIPAWIKKACPNGDYSNLIVNIGEKETENRWSIEISPEDNYKSYFNQTSEVLDRIIGNRNNLQILDVDKGTEYGVSLKRENFKTEESSHDVVGLPEDLKDQGKGLLEFYTTSTKDGQIFNLGRSITKEQIRLCEQDQKVIKFPPICLFNGSDDMQYVHMDDNEIMLPNTLVEERYRNYTTTGHNRLLNWDNILENRTSSQASPLSSEIAYSEHSESSTNSSSSAKTVSTESGVVTARESLNSVISNVALPMSTEEGVITGRSGSLNSSSDMSASLTNPELLNELHNIARALKSKNHYMAHTESSKIKYDSGREKAFQLGEKAKSSKAPWR
jgi:hypothetical protein